MGAPSKELGITVAICTAVNLWTYWIAWDVGGTPLLLAITETLIIAIGSIMLWHLGPERIKEEFTRVMEKLDVTKIWERGAQDQRQPNINAPEGGVYCMHCGRQLPGYAKFCRFCGKEQ